MDLKNSLALLERKNMELKEEYGSIKNELEHILFDLPFDYNKAFMDESDKYFIYPCVHASKHFHSISEKYKISNNCITRNYVLYSPIQKETIMVVETATLEKKTNHFKFTEMDVEITSTIVSKICYTLKLGDFEFSFSKNFYENNYIDYYDEKLNLKDLKDSFEAVTLRNTKIENNFLASVKPFHFNDEINYSLTEYINEYIETGKNVFFIHFDTHVIGKIGFESFIKDFPIQLNCNCNKISITFFEKFEVVNYSGNVFLQTLIDRKRICDFSDSGYGVIRTKVPENDEDEIEIKKIFLN